MNRILRPIAAPALVLAAQAAVFAAPAASESPDVTLNRGLAELLSKVEGRDNKDPVELAKRVRPVLEKFFNFESLTQKAMGAGWRDFSPDHKSKAVRLFSEMIIRSYTSRFDPSSKVDIQFAKASDLAPGKKEVPATARYQGKAVAVAYRVESSAGGWRVYDVIVEGVSLAGNYRAQFESIRQKGGPDAVIRSMEQKLD
jgi:phospholipid transport system substrate-binding protein